MTPRTPDLGAIQVQVLGPTRVVRRGSDGVEVPIEPISDIQRRLLCCLAVASPRPVGVEELSESVWSGEPPPTAKAAIQNQISRLRARVHPEVVLTSSGGYKLNASSDIDGLGEEPIRIRALLDSGDHTTAFAESEELLGRWRGTALDDLESFTDDHSTGAFIAELHKAFEDLRLEAGIAMRRHEWTVPEAERLVALTPHDERRWALLMQSLELAGRRGEALGAYERARRSLADRLGLEPGPELRALEASVLGETASTGVPVQSPLVGRETLLSRVLDGAERGCSAILCGEVGSGKSRALQELERRLRRAGATTAGASSLLYPSTAIATLSDLASELGGSIDGARSPVDAFLEVVSAAAHGERVVLVVDDLDQVGPTTASALAAATAVANVVLIGTATDTDLLSHDLRELTVHQIEALTEAEILELVARHVSERTGGPGEIDDSTVDSLLSLSGGNPLIVEHLLADTSWIQAIGRGDLDVEQPAPSLALRELVRRRVGRLSRTTQVALRAAAVCGPTFPESILTQLAPERGVAGAIAASLLHEQVRWDERWLGFNHGAVRQIIYDDMSPGQRMEIHHRVAELLRSTDAPAARGAVHAIASAEVDPPAAVEMVLDAGRESASYGAHADAARWFEEAVALAGGADVGHLRVEALIGMGNSLRMAGSPDHAEALFRAAAAAFDIGDPTLVGDAAFSVLQLGATTSSGSLDPRVPELTERSLAMVTDDEQRALITAAASLTHSMTDSASRCREMFLDAEATAARAETRCQVLPFAYLALGHPRDLDLRERLTAELIGIAADAGDPVASFEGFQLAFSNALQRCDGVALREALAQMEGLVDTVGDIGRRWALLYQQAALAHLDDDLDRSERIANEALELFVAVSPSRAFAAFGAQLLPIRIAQGRVGELEETIAQLLNEQPEVTAWNAAMALTLAPSDPSRAVQYATAALADCYEDFTWLAATMVGGRAAAMTGDEGTARAYIDRLSPWSGLACWQGTCCYGPVDGVLFLLHREAGDAAVAARHRTAALAQSRVLGAAVFERELSGSS